MAVIKKGIHEFMELCALMPVLDVRSPREYLHAHIPGAHSFPIFNDEERKEIGTTYKQESREKAIKIGLKYFGVKMLHLVEKAEAILADSQFNSKTIAVHCWRGGMRSATMAWLLDLYGFKVYLLEGGYKAYRNWVLKQFEPFYPLHIISGYTGSNKTGIIELLQERGERVIDLEKIASHKGSAFGSLGMPPQPSQEMFENMLAMALWPLQVNQTSVPIWIEDESQRIGQVNIPAAFFKSMREQGILFLEIDFEQRLDFIVATYGTHEKEKLISSIERIQKKLGGLETKEAIQAIHEGDLRHGLAIILKYYDRLYIKSSMKRNNAEKNIERLELSSTNAKSNVEQLIQYVRN